MTLRPLYKFTQIIQTIIGARIIDLQHPPAASMKLYLNEYESSTEPCYYLLRACMGPETNTVEVVLAQR